MLDSPEREQQQHRSSSAPPDQHLLHCHALGTSRPWDASSPLLFDSSRHAWTSKLDAKENVQGKVIRGDTKVLSKLTLGDDFNYSLAENRVRETDYHHLQRVWSPPGLGLDNSGSSNDPLVQGVSFLFFSSGSYLYINFASFV